MLYGILLNRVSVILWDSEATDKPKKFSCLGVAVARFTWEPAVIRTSDLSAF